MGGLELFQIERPFSNFAFLDERFPGCPITIRRLFSQARARKCQTLAIEKVPAAAAVEDEIGELRALYPDYQLGGLVRLSFWKEQLHEGKLAGAKDGDCIGYALLKQDIVPSLKRDSWHVFESVITKHDHKHNYTPCDKSVAFCVGNRQFTARGVLYGQQNQLNKACAQVALRSLATAYLENYDLSFRRINELAAHAEAGFNPGEGLTLGQTLHVLRDLGINFAPLDYSTPTKFTQDFPFHRAIYSGIECALGSLLVFALPASARRHRPNPGEMHMIACFGHTFNEDTWAPTADVEYFGDDEFSYIPSDAWMSSFLVHDDNFGSNLCIPKAYLDPKLARCVIAFMPRGYKYPGFAAEVVAANLLYSVVQPLKDSTNHWFRRLVKAADDTRLILRVLPISKDGYLAHLAAIDDWEELREKPDALKALDRMIGTKSLWMVEVSFPDLFATNKRKVGEVLLDGANDFGETLTEQFVMARFPGTYVLPEKPTTAGAAPTFLTVPSALQSHTSVLIR